MKKINYYISTLVMLVMVCGCTTQVDDVFEQNASARLNAHMAECKELLTSAPNGWVIEYYPERNRSYGGYIFLAKFDADGNVTVSGEVGGPSKKVTSHYSLVQSNSATLTFDTYNELFHYYADPDNGNGSSYEGDFEFTYMSGDADKMTFKGTKTGNVTTFRRMDDQTDWADYLNGVANVKNQMLVSPYSYFVFTGDNGQRVSFELDTNYSILTYAPDESRPEELETMAFCYTENGISLYETVKVGSTDLEAFTWDEATGNLVSTAETGVVMEGTTSENYVPYDTFLGDWKLLYNTNRIMNVTISENVRGASYTLSGISSFDITLEYVKKDGNLSMTTQYLGRYGQYYVYLCPWDTTVGYLTWAEGVGCNLVYNGDETNPELSFVDNGRWVNSVSSGMLYYAFTSAAAGNSTAAGSLLQLPGLVKLYR